MNLINDLFGWPGQREASIRPPCLKTQMAVIYAWGRKANLAWFGIARWGST